MYRTRPERTYPPAWRIVAAFVLVPGLAALIATLSVPLYAGLPSLADRIWRSTVVYGLFGAYPAAIVLGIPAYFLLRRNFDPTLASCALTGAVVAAAPWAFLSMASTPDEASIGGRATVINGSKTAFGWLTEAQFIGRIALLGALAGALFWAIAAAGSGAGKVRLPD